MTNIDNRRQECQCIPIAVNCKIIAAQISAHALKSTHPCHEAIHGTQRHRKLRYTVPSHLEKTEEELQLYREDTTKKKIDEEVFKKPYRDTQTTKSSEHHLHFRQTKLTKNSKICHENKRC